MKDLLIYVCENYLPEFRYLAESEGLEDVKIVPFKSFCDGGVPAEDSLSGLDLGEAVESDRVLVCSHFCRASRNGEYKKKFSRIYESLFCYSHMISDQFARFFAEEGYYVVTTGWLADWEEHIARQGFTRETAEKFYQEYFSKIVFLDTGIYEEAEKSLSALSDFIGIPAKTISVKLDLIRTLLNHIVSDWKMRRAEPARQDGINELRELNAMNSAVLHIMSRIAAAEYKRDVISILDEIWMVLFGASKSRFWSYSEGWIDAPDAVRNLDISGGQIYRIDKDSGTFYALLESAGEIFGVVEVGDFIFPEKIEKYSELFNSIIRIAALAISNAQRYEELVASRNEHEYNSYHDGMTGVYNRAYFDTLLPQLKSSHPIAVFAVDLDGLKDINDTLGHSEGDKLIRTTAEVLKKTFRESDYIFRMGGDEFTVIVRDCNDQLAADLFRRLEINVGKVNRSASLKLGLSTGFFVSSGPDADIEEMARKADLNMYREKRSRKKENKQE